MSIVSANHYGTTHTVGHARTAALGDWCMLTDTKEQADCYKAI